MKKLIFPTILSFLFTLPARAQLYELFSPEVFAYQEKDSLQYRWLSPADIVAGERYPLIIFLHGAGERGDDNRAQLVHVMKQFISPERRSQYPCFIMAPQCPKEVWWSAGRFGKDGYESLPDPNIREEMIMAWLDKALAKFPIDPDRIYLGGLSMGGFGTWDMMRHYPNRFAATFPICGGGDPAWAEQIKHIPTWVFHGGDDQVVRPELSRDLVAALRAAGGKPIYTEFPGVGHNSWDYAFTEHPYIYDWLFAQKKTND